MALRTVVLDGTAWNVWDVRPAGSGPFHVSLATAPGLEDGWLCFDCPEQKRRLAPVPQGWELWPDERLLELLAAAAVVVPRRPGPVKRISVPLPISE